MRHRMASGFGLGNPSQPLLNNKGAVNGSFASDAITEYFQRYEGFDYQINEDEILVGIEPAYQYDRLKIIRICKNKSDSYIQIGRAWGPYGSQIGSTTKYYKDYKNKSKFVRFVDRWHVELFGK